jgi:hypothetical protein
MDTREVVQAAVEKVHELDEHLEGMRPKRWMLIVESDDDEGATVSVTSSGDMPPWETLGLLRFATLQEEGRSFSDIDEDPH